MQSQNDAQMEFFAFEQVQPEYVIAKASWLGNGGDVTILPGKSEAVLLCCRENGTPVVIEESYSQAGMESITPTNYNVILTLSCVGSAAYSKRFHLRLDAGFTLNATLCQDSAESCQICKRFNVS